MHVLISNDDGIHAAGLRALAKAAEAAGHRATIVAPDAQRSAASHCFTLFETLYPRPVEFDGLRAFSLNGTPADCARLGLYLLRDDPVDFVLSGINNGSNRGAGVLYSGTVAAAMEGSICGVPGLAVSRCAFDDCDYELSAQMGIRVMEWAVRHPLPRGEIYNLNVPAVARVRGLRAASLSNEFINTPAYEPQADGGYRLANGSDQLPETRADSDLLLTEAGFATLSIVSWSLLSNTPMPDLRKLSQAWEDA